MILIFASFLNGDQLFQERIFSIRSIFFPVRVDPIFEMIIFQGNRWEVTKIVSVCNKVKKTLRCTSFIYIWHNFKRQVLEQYLNLIE